MIEIVSATRLAKDAFWAQSALGRSLTRLEPDERWVPRIAFENRRGLPEVFNERIDLDTEHDILVFMHDDVWIDDFFLCDHLSEALDEFHVAGVAGNTRRVARQPAWLFPGDDLQWDDRANLSGGIAHGAEAGGRVELFGPAPRECELLDGVFLAARRSTLRERGVRFDPRFGFHFYDLDFCRSARAQALRLGTWPIALTHQSGGKFGAPDWRAAREAYLEKWGE